MDVTPTATVTYTLTATNAAGSTTATATLTVVGGVAPVINTFTASPATIPLGSSSTLSWKATGATSIAITPGSFTSTYLTSPATGSTTVSPTTATAVYTLTATNSAGSTTATATVSVTGTLNVHITTSSCPGGTQMTAYAGCTIAAAGGTPPYQFSINETESYPSLPEGLSLNASTGAITGPIVGGQGYYKPEIIVTDSDGNQGSAGVSFEINGSNAFLASIFPANSIFHHRVDAATTGLPVDASPAAPIYSVYQTEAIKPFFGNTTGSSFPNGIPAIEVPYNQPDVTVSTKDYQSYFNSGPIPAYAPIEGTSHYTGGDRHVLVYREAGDGNDPALYEMWASTYEDGPWTDGSNALWPNVAGDNLTPQGEGTSDAAGLPVAPLLANADEVIGTGTPSAPKGTVKHPIRFTVTHMLNYWVWPSTGTAGVGTCTAEGEALHVGTIISQSKPPSSCTHTGPAGEIYRLKASVATPACAATSPQAAIIITALRNYGIILADNGDSGGLIGTPDARWNDKDLECLTSLKLSNFEPVNVSSLMMNDDSGETK